MELHILTNAYHSTSDFASEIDSFVLRNLSGLHHLSEDSLLTSTGQQQWNDFKRALPAVHILPRVLQVRCLLQLAARSQASHQSHTLCCVWHQRHMPHVYAAADAFVLPSRGEGWGRPHAEAMAMALPVIGKPLRPRHGQRIAQPIDVIGRIQPRIGVGQRSI